MKSLWWKRVVKPVIKSEEGFTLAEIMVAAGLLGVISLAIMQLTTNIEKSTKKLYQDSNRNQLYNSIATNMMNSNACANSFVRNDLPPATALHFPAGVPSPPPIHNVGINPQVNGVNAGVDREIRDKNNRVILSVGDIYGGNDKGALSIEQIRLANYENGAAPFNNGAQTATLEIRVKTRKAARLEGAGLTEEQAADIVRRDSLGQASTYIRIPVKVRLEGGVVVNCYTEFESHLQTVCNSTLQGTHQELSSGKCKSIMIEPNNSEPATDIDTMIFPEAALTISHGSVELIKDRANRGTIAVANDASLDMEGGLGVGTTRSTGDGNINASGGAVIGDGSVPTTGDLKTSSGIIAGNTDAAADPADGDIKAASGFVAGDTTNGVNPDNGDYLATGGISLGALGVNPDNGDVMATGGASFGAAGANPDPGDVLALGGAALGAGMANPQAGDLLLQSGIAAGSGISTNPDNGDILGSGGLSVGVAAPNPAVGDILATSGIKAGNTGVAPADGDIIARGGISVGVTGIQSNPNTGWVDADVGMVIRTVIPANPTAMASAASSSVDELVPNIGWVRGQIARTLAPTSADVSQIMSDIMDTAIGDADSAAIILKRNICQNTRIRHANGTYASGTWESGTNTCRYETFNCSEIGRCDNVYANASVFAGSNVQAGQNVIAQGNVVASTGNVTAGVDVRANRDLRAGRNLYVTSNAYANYIRSYGNMYADGDIDVDDMFARNRGCIRGSCYTRLHSAICGGAKSVMVGIRNGLIICANKW